MTDYSFFIHQAAMDPTRTATLRARWVADWNRRIKALQRVVWKSVVTNDCLGLKEGERPTLQAMAALDPADPKQWAYRWSHEKVAEFMKWLQEMESRSLLEIVMRDTLRPGGEPWSNIYVRSAYQRGLQMSYDEMRKRSSGEIAQRLGLTEADFPPTFRPTGGAISAIMQQPFHADRLALAYTRVFDELKGVTAEMDKQISQILTRGIAEGLNPRDIGELLADRIEKIGGTRGRLIARTETIHVHQQAALNEYYATEQSTGEVMLVEWKATMDSRTRDTHAERNRRVYTKEEAYKLVGEPNCRCALLPFIPAVQGMPEKATSAARAAAERAVGKAEVPVEEKKAKESKSDPETLRRKWLDANDELYKQGGPASKNYFELIRKVKEAKYRYLEVAPEEAYREVRQTSIDNLLGMGSPSRFARAVKDGLEIYPIDLLDALGDSGYKLIYKDTKGRAHFSSGDARCFLFKGDGPTVVAHEFAHAVDDFLSGGKGTGLQWKGVTTTDFSDIAGSRVSFLRDEFRSIISKKGSPVKGTYTNGDGSYWKDNWVNDYEGRIYGKYGEAGVEWWSMNSQYYHEYHTALNFGYENRLRLLKKESVGTSEYNRKQKIAYDMLLEEGAESYASRNARNWYKAKQRYPELTNFIESVFGRRLMKKW